MNSTNHKHARLPDTSEDQTRYEMPAIIYEGIITTRAGTPDGQPAGSSENSIDPADLFGSGG